MGIYHSALDLVRQWRPEQPVAMVRPTVASVAAQWFQTNFNGDIFYAVKSNPSPWMLEALRDAGVRSFDVASLPEIELARSIAPQARLAFMHPVKNRAAITRAYFDYGVKIFSLDTHEELQKILDATGGAKDLTLIVRMAASGEGSSLPLSGKFGVSELEAPSLLMAARRATEDLMGISFHVGSQCMRPSAYANAMAGASRALSRAGVFADIVDVGGGFPSVYPGMIPPAMQDYVDTIHRAFEQMNVHHTAELWAEPGRALCAEASSVLVKVDLRKGDTLYINDGSYGTLFDATHAKWPFPVRAVRDDEGETELKPFRFYGPTCDSIDHMAGPYMLPADINEGDYIEIGMLGAYGVAMATRFNGYGDVLTAEVGDAPMASMYDLAPRYLPLPKQAQEDAKVVRFSRARGKKRRRK